MYFLIILFLLGEKLEPSATHLIPSIEVSQWFTMDILLIALNHQRGVHDIENGITYEGSNFIFHDSQGFESGAMEEIDVVWDFIEKQSAATKLKDQLHAIWYCGICSLPK
jgi:hypothetical protein